MVSTIARINRASKRWTNHLETTTGLRLEPHICIALATLAIVSVQVFLFVLISTKRLDTSLSVKVRHICNLDNEQKDLATIYVITPTYSRYVQKAELTRLSHTLLLVPKIHWIIVEDSQKRTDLIKRFVKRLELELGLKSVTHLTEITPSEFKLKPGQPSWSKPKGVWQRNRALRWLRNNRNIIDSNGVIFFADDDNTYDLDVFNEMRTTKKISVWPVAFAGGLLVEKPILDADSGRVVGFNSMWRKERPFPFDMSGFAMRIQVLLARPEAEFSADQDVGYIESHFIGQFVSNWTELEPKAANCTEILVWHTRTQRPALHEEKKLVLPSDTGMV